MRRVIDVQFLLTLLGSQPDRFVCEDREAKLASVAAQLDAVGASTLVTDEAP